MKIMFLLAFGVIVFVIMWWSMFILFGVGDIIYSEEDLTWRVFWGDPGRYIIVFLFYVPFQLLGLLLCILAYIQAHYILKSHMRLRSFISEFKKDTDMNLRLVGPGRIFFGAWSYNVGSEENWERMTAKEINEKSTNRTKAFMKSTYEEKINAYEEMESLIIDESQRYANWKLHKEVYKCIRNRSNDALRELGKLNRNRSYSDIRQLGYHYGRCYAYYKMLIRMENFMYVISALDRFLHPYMLHYNIEIALEHPLDPEHPPVIELLKKKLRYIIYKPPFRLNRQKWCVRYTGNKSPFTETPF